MVQLQADIGNVLNIPNLVLVEEEQKLDELIDR